MPNINVNFITSIDEPYQRSSWGGRGHRRKYIIHNGMWYFAEFDTKEQLDSFADMMGFSYELVEEREDVEGHGMWRRYSMSHEIVDPCNGGFSKVEQLPAGAKAFKGLSNGSIVDCYFLNDGERIHIYRPNPNCKDIYQPLSIEEHIAYVKAHGLC